MQDQRLSLNPARTVLVVVDVQNDRHKPGGMSYGELDEEELARTARYLPRLVGLLARCRAEKVRVIHSQSIRAADDPWFRVFGTRLRLLEGTWGVEIIEEAKPLAQEPVVQKRCLDCFANTTMESVLEQMNVTPSRDKIVVVGGANSSCGYHAVVGFSQRYYDVIVPMDCVYGAEQGERFMVEQLSSPEYRANVTLTDSEKIAFGRQETE
jgi:nicotinamidase-related amidase